MPAPANPEAIRDLQHALDHGCDAATVYYNLTLVHLEQADQAAALASLQCAEEHHLAAEEVRKLRKRVQRCGKQPVDSAPLWADRESLVRP